MIVVFQSLCLILCDSVNCNTPGFPVLNHLLEFVQNHVHCVDDAIQATHPLSPPCPLALNHSQHQVLLKVGALHLMARVLELQYQSFQ